MTKLQFSYFLIVYDVNKNAFLAFFWIVFKSSALFSLGQLRPVETAQFKRIQVPGSQAARNEDIPHENAGESCSLCGEGRKKVILWWRCCVTEALPPAPVPVSKASP